ncbi:biopolymer transporter ExbD [Pseudothauera nasutitermitis]|uniref:Biopolymer transporter ExbD n=1 Tax=Pseudothauera nasutitermitis TaxID=2565930 RepID=A0A4S4ASH9_9RHOO|nr:biopolymer transporter ExbD [Pseudothauera nasutitermitis]THF62797.1 biopolymer transporter ExbD [Pseudothauera nasutitermitis]
MGMNLQGPSPAGEPEVMMDINTTPLIDVMLVLLIMLIVTIPIQLHSVALNLPQGNPPPVVEPEVVRLHIEGDGTILWNGETLAGLPGLEARLAAAAAQAIQPELHIRPDAAVAYQVVVSVMAAVQRNRLNRIGLLGNEQFL